MADGTHRVAVRTDAAPAALGPYSQAVWAGDVLFLSGQLALDPATGQLVTGDAAAETRQVLDNIGAVLTAAGLSFDAVVKSTVFLVDLADFAAMNGAYAAYFTAPPPARSTIGISALPKGARVEIEVVARRPTPR